MLLDRILGCFVSQVQTVCLDIRFHLINSASFPVLIHDDIFEVLIPRERIKPRTPNLFELICHLLFPSKIEGMPSIGCSLKPSISCSLVFRSSFERVVFLVNFGEQKKQPTKTNRSSQHTSPLGKSGI